MLKFYLPTLCQILILLHSADCVCLNDSQHHNRCLNIDGEKSIRFFILGDWGGKLAYPYTTRTQIKVATAIEKVSGLRREANFYLSTGDNFYNNGVKNIADTRFQETFENVYGKRSHHKPWYMVAGNHDYNGNVTAQLAYTKHSRRWVFPSNFYTVSYNAPDAGITVDFVMIDTIRLCGHEKDDSIEQNNDLHPDITNANEGLEWIEKELKKSRAGYLFVVGHYPVISSGLHGPNRCLKKGLLPILQAYNVSAYLCGHDHTLQVGEPASVSLMVILFRHLIIPPAQGSSNNRETNFIISGMGAKRDHHRRPDAEILPAKNFFFYPKTQRGRHLWKNVDKGGFVYCNVTRKSANFIFYGIEGENLYNFRLKPRFDGLKTFLIN